MFKKLLLDLEVAETNVRNHHPVTVYAERHASVYGVGPECFAGDLGENINQLQMEFTGSTEITQ